MLESFIKTYAPESLDKSYKHTAMLSHGGVVVAFALDSSQQFWYTVLDLENNEIQSPLDVNYWFKEPVPINFPKEITQVGYSIAGNQTIPDPTEQLLTDGTKEVKPDKDKTLEERFLASTARFTADAPFQVMSDGQFVYLIRQAIEGKHPRNVKVGDVPIVNSTLLIDRFVFVGTELKPKLEVRYQRSRHKHRPLNRKDSLSSKDLEGQPFYEPTQELDMVRNLTEGRFSVALLPTAIPNIKRWQIFAHNSRTGLIDSFNIERSKDGLFNPRGTQFYTCGTHSEVFEYTPGKCPECASDLIPKVTTEGFAESALVFNGTDTWVETRLNDLSGSALTIEYWFKGNSLQSAVRQQEGGNYIVAAWHGKHILSNDGGTENGIPVGQLATDGKWHHIAMTWKQNTENGFVSYLDGQVVAQRKSSNTPLPKINAQVLLGSFYGGELTNGVIDEIRIWNRARNRSEIKADLNRRLVGNEDGLIAYWRFDEGSGKIVHDQTDNAHHGQIKGSGSWVQSDAPVGDNPGVTRSSFEIAQRTIAGGLSALLYYQQENIKSGYSNEPKPLKKSARMMLAAPTRQGGEDKNCIAILDFAVSREGKLALIPDTVSLPVLGNTGAACSINDALDRRSTLEVEIANLKQRTDDLTKRINQLRVDINNSQSEVEQLQQTISIKQAFISQEASFVEQQQAALNQMAIYGGWNISYAYLQYQLRQAIANLNQIAQDKIAVSALSKQIVEKANAVSKALQELHDSERELDEKQWDLTVKLFELEVIRNAQLGEVRVPMELLHIDRFGLTVAGGLLSFAFTNDSPTLFDSALGKLGLYFRGSKDDQFFAAYFDTLTERAVYTLAAETGQVVLTARNTDGSMDKTAITVENGSTDATCKLTFSNSETQLTETWPDLPREVKIFAEILNGNAILPLAKSAPNQNQTLVLVDTDDPINPNQPIYYDYTQVILSQADKSAAKGSLFFSVTVGNASGAIQNTQTPINLGEIKTRVNEWVADSQGNALYFDGTTTLARQGDAVQLDRFDSLSNITVETWVKASSIKPNQMVRLINHHSPRSRYFLGLKGVSSGSAYPLEAAIIVAGVNEQLIQTENSVLINEWTHLAGAFRQSFALQFDGKDDHLNAGTAEDLNLTQDLTIEVFLRVAELGQERGILTKGRLDDGGDQDVPYSLSVGANGKLIFAFEKTDHRKEKCESDRSLVAGQFCKIAVTRTQGTDKQENKVKKVIGGQEMEVTESVTVNQWQEIRFFINGQSAGVKRYEEVTPGTTDQPLEIGKAYRDGGVATFFKGIISEVRLWNKARAVTDLGKALKGSESGLSSWWRFEENAGNTAFDSKGNNHADRIGARWVKNPDPEGSIFTLYINGVSQKTRIAEGTLKSGDQNFTLGGYRENNVQQELFKGSLEETRVWRTTRTQEQIQDNLFRRVLGDRKDLLTYYQFDADAEDRLPDCSGRANHLIVTNPTWQISNAPVSYETPQVRSALAGVRTSFQEQIHSRPAIQEYGDTQYNSDSELVGVMKRCYSYIKDGEWQLITGFKIGNIITEWIGQAQYDPQIVGFIEGAPPVPSENCTMDAQDDYGGGSSVEIVEADNVQYTLSASKESTLDAAFKMAASVGGGTGTYTVIAPFGGGIAQEVTEIDFSANLEGSMETSNGWSNESSVSTGKNVSKNTKVKGIGCWESENHVLNPAIGQRFVFNNTGFALVQSDTADIFALRMEHNNVLIAFRFQPNPDIPKDWNLIPFQINPRYVCQGTLDGRVGMNDNGNVYDPNYQNARDYGEYSYFKPKEAYALKNRIRQEEEELKTYYENFSTSPLDADRAGKGAAIGAGIGAIAGGPLGAVAGAAVGGLIGGLTGDKRLPAKLAKRNLVNTYVWTAEGGFFAETTELTDSMSETVGGSFSLSGAVGGGFGTDIEIFGVGISLEMEASLGGSLNLTKSKTRDSEKSFSLNVELEVPDNIQKYVEGKPIYDQNGKPVLQAGKVDAYRFMTFYLEPSVQNFDTFVNKVVDPIWLEESKHPNAAAIRSALKAQQKAKKDTEKSIPWRVMHRVTFVSRVLPEIAPDQTPQTPEETLKAADIDSNYELIKRLEPFVSDKLDDYVQFTDAVRNAIDAYIPELKPAKDYIVEYMCQYYQVFD